MMNAMTVLIKVELATHLLNVKHLVVKERVRAPKATEFVALVSNRLKNTYVIIHIL